MRTAIDGLKATAESEVDGDESDTSESDDSDNSNRWNTGGDKVATESDGNMDIDKKGCWNWDSSDKDEDNLEVQSLRKKFYEDDYSPERAPLARTIKREQPLIPTLSREPSPQPTKAKEYMKIDKDSSANENATTFAFDVAVLGRVIPAAIRSPIRRMRSKGI
ncbi:hypothetical protein BD410DRAFT_845893 [Rickenella mellea]|uniref:Uncharacterized protein n=1 Tax=Rickenella mellea TaxID=50990 RepID=A0A4Y7PJK4_9AGAM|nr:hypothetical protein BD410DRAFT_845893 [Rickenella mellea]